MKRWTLKGKSSWVDSLWISHSAISLPIPPAPEFRKNFLIVHELELFLFLDQFTLKGISVHSNGDVIVLDVRGLTQDPPAIGCEVVRTVVDKGLFHFAQNWHPVNNFVPKRSPVISVDLQVLLPVRSGNLSTLECWFGFWLEPACQNST